MNLIAVSSSGLALSIEALGWTLLHFVWQGALVGLVLLAVLVLARNSSAQLRYLAACGALCLMFAAAVSTFVWQFAALTRTTSQTSMLARNVTPLPRGKERWRRMADGERVGVPSRSPERDRAGDQSRRPGRSGDGDRRRH